MKNFSIKKIGILSLLFFLLTLLSARTKVSESAVSYSGGLHFITFKQLVNYLNDFRNTTSTYNLDKETQGGYVDANVIDSIISAGAQGIVFHYCYDPEVNSKPFLAFQACSDSSSINIGNNDVLNVSFNEHTSANNTSSSITAELFSSPLPITGQNTTITGTYARNCKTQFTNSFGSGNVTIAHGYINAQELLQLKQENSSRILHYFWGFDETESVNKLRLCFVGYNITDENNYILDTNTQSYHSFIDRSWP